MGPCKPVENLTLFETLNTSRQAVSVPFWILRCMFACLPKSYKTHMAQAQNSSNLASKCVDCHRSRTKFDAVLNWLITEKENIGRSWCCREFAACCICFTQCLTVLKMNGASARCRSALILYLALSFHFRLTNEQLRFVLSVHVCAFCFT